MSTSKITTAEFISRANTAHGVRYDYSNVVFTSVTAKVVIGCESHGSFEQVARDHMRGVGCRKCSLDKSRITFKTFLERARLAHGELYSYDEASWNDGPFVTVICATHGSFQQRWYNHTKGDGCTPCYRGSRRLSRPAVAARITEIHGDKITLVSEGFVATNEQGLFNCIKHGVFTAWLSNILAGQDCSNCSQSARRSKAEEDFFSEVLRIYPDAIASDRKLLKGKELDVFVPSLSLGIEFNGDYWHSDAVVIPRRGVTAREMHEQKLALAKSNGIDLLFLWESDWFSQREFVLECLQKFSVGEVDPIFRKLSHEVNEVE